MKRIYMFLLSVVIISSLLLSGCEDKSDLTAPAAPATGDADFSRFVTIGNSLTAGYMNGGLYQSGQEYSFGNQIAKQLQTSFEQPIYSDPGTPGRFEVQSVSPFALAVNTSSGTPMNTQYASPYNNLGVPGSLLAEILTAKSASTSLTQNPMFDLVLRGIGTMAEQAAALQPTVLTCWLGNNDILGYASRGGTVPYTPEAAFTQVYTAFG